MDAVLVQDRRAVRVLCEMGPASRRRSAWRETRCSAAVPTICSSGRSACPAFPSNCDKALIGTIGKSTSRQVLGRLGFAKSGTTTLTGLPKFGGTCVITCFLEAFFGISDGQLLLQVWVDAGKRRLVGKSFKAGHIELSWTMSLRRELDERNDRFQQRQPAMTKMRKSTLHGPFSLSQRRLAGRSGDLPVAAGGGAARASLGFHSTSLCPESIPQQLDRFSVLHFVREESADRVTVVRRDDETPPLTDAVHETARIRPRKVAASSGRRRFPVHRLSSRGGESKARQATCATRNSRGCGRDRSDAIGERGVKHVGVNIGAIENERRRRLVVEQL